MKISFTGLSDPGLVRSSNQDSYHTDPEGRFFIIADGMGGHAGGEEASQIATREIRQYLLNNWYSLRSGQELLQEACFQANESILEGQRKHPECADMGTTVVVFMIREGESPYLAYVGDSRLYRFRDKQLQQITQDHTWVARALKMGDISPEEARAHPFRHVLSRCLGREDLMEIDVEPLEIEKSDYLLLCSDGLTEELVDEEIAACLRENSLLEKAAMFLVDGAKKEGGRDNITVVIINFEE
ncbi:Stp1/IreP family PP2C-type Ser/Thr phosphatase [Richelia intracellularis]|uniref:Stp1/IreP family PP2C-type Ser/Thr phosphatase n=1 Tax=Richelia intracellularis TaxID=1164990 RepID=UPI000349D75E|nr:Stp1/IreP family PP2C-type Ser/Thr phosphatase [Richelia intracellularis]